MATSGSSDFNATRNEIIEGAARKIQAIGAGVTMSAQMLGDFNKALNAMVKRWSAKGLHVWTVSEATLFPQSSQTKYAVSLSGADHVTSSYVETALSAAAADAASTITVDSITGISNGDNIGIVVDDGTLHWTTVNGAPSGSTITLTAALDDSASVDAAVYAYTTKIVRPLKIVDARRYNPSSGNETPIEIVARKQYRHLPNKTQTGEISQLFYDPQLTTGYVYLWNAPDGVDELVNFTWHRPIEDFDAAGNNPDLPQEWIDTLIFNLAVVMAPEFDTPTEKFNQLVALAAQCLDDLSGHDREAESLMFQPGFD